MHAHLYSNPPHGHPISVVPTGPADKEGSASRYSVQFDVALELLPNASSQTGKGQWHVQVWHDHQCESDDDEWTALPLQHVRDGWVNKAHFMEEDGSKQILWFTGTLYGRPHAFRTKTSFTLRFCNETDRPFDRWRWISETDGNNNGELLYQPEEFAEDELTKYLTLSKASQLHATQRRSEAPYTLLWLLSTHEAPPASEECSGWGKFPLGRPHGIERWFSLARISTPWLGPRQGTTHLADGQSVVYSFLRNDGLHVVILAISGIQAAGNVQAVLCRDESLCGLNLITRNDESTPGRSYATLSVGRSLQAALAAAMYEARKLIKSFQPPQKMLGTDEEQAISPKDGHMTTNWYQEWIDGLTFCTWNSIGLDVSESKIHRALKALAEAGVSVSNLVVDDGWQRVDKPGASNMHQALVSWEADPAKFAQGLQHFVSSTKSRFPNIKHVAVWHALLGYWSGISRHGDIARKYRLRNVDVRPGAMTSSGRMAVVEADDAGTFYRDFYRFLEQSNISAIKTDVQFALDELITPKDRRELTTAHIHAWQNAHLTYFGGRSTGCMSQTPTLMLGNQLRNDLGPAVPTRNSDDYLPDVEDSHTWHVWCNAHNAVFTSFLHVIPDWDMFQTTHTWGDWHAASRCLSGGPITVTDEPGKHDLDIIRKAVAVTPCGETIVLRPSVVGRTSHVYTSYEDKALLRVVCYNGSTDSGTSMLGLFNMRDDNVREVVKVDDMMGILPRGWYVLRRLGTEQMSGAVEAKEVFSVNVRPRKWDIITAYPVTRLHARPGVGGGSSIVGVAPLGLIDHYTGSVALLDFRVDVRPTMEKALAHRIHSRTVLKALGRYGMWMSLAEWPRVEEDVLILLANQVVPIACVSVQATRGGCIITVDLVDAWRHMEVEEKLARRRSNEVALDILVTIRC